MRIEVVRSAEIVRPGGDWPLVLQVWNADDAARRCRLHLLGLQPGWPQTGNSDGDVEMAGIEWRWEVTVAENPDPRVRRVDITVRPKGAAGASAALSSFVAERRP